ncbi:hypothetical protein STEG23_017943 [Scotinomys teguina]
MANSSSSAYGAYFERLYVIQSGTIMYQGGRGPDGYQVSELRTWLERYDEQLHVCPPIQYNCTQYLSKLLCGYRQTDSKVD